MQSLQELQIHRVIVIISNGVARILQHHTNVHQNFAESHRMKVKYHAKVNNRSKYTMAKCSSVSPRRYFIPPACLPCGANNCRIFQDILACSPSSVKTWQGINVVFYCLWRVSLLSNVQERHNKKGGKLSMKVGVETVAVFVIEDIELMWSFYLCCFALFTLSVPLCVKCHLESWLCFLHAQVASRRKEINWNHIVEHYICCQCSVSYSFLTERYFCSAFFIYLLVRGNHS